MKSVLVAVPLGLLLLPSAYAQTAADAYYDTEEMAAARAALKKHHGNQINSLVILERFELKSFDDDDIGVWEAQAWVGNDEDKVWFKSEGEYAEDDGRLEEAELQALYSRAIGPFWDVQFGLRRDFRPEPTRTYAVVGLQGLAPYWFELDSQLFLSDEGDVSVRLEAEYDVRLAQRLILQPRLEVNAAFSDDETIGIGSGVSTAEFGLRLRYEIRREFAPYFGVSWERAFGKTRDLQDAVSADADGIALTAGLRIWF